MIRHVIGHIAAWACVLAGGAAVGATATSGLSSALSGATTTNLQVISTFDSDWMYNYDFSSLDTLSNNVDWAVTAMFYNNADVNKVKNALNFEYSSTGGPQWARLNDLGNWAWDSDKGRKQPGCVANQWYRHYRVYADWPDYMYNTAWGRYVIATQHYDINDGCHVNPASGYSEIADGWLANAAGAVWGTGGIFQDYFHAKTPEPVYRFEVTSNGFGHHWDVSEGKATIIRVP